MRKLLTILFLACACVGAHIPAYADTAPTRIGDAKNTCQKFTLCAAQTATGVCTVLPASGDEIVLNAFGRWSRFTFYINQSVGTPFSCHVFSNNTGYTAESGDGVQLTSTALSNTDEAITLNEADFGHIWVNCSVIETSVTVTVNACPSMR